MSKDTLAPQFHTLFVAQTYKQLGVSASGLTTPNAAQRLKKFGHNTLPEPPKATGLFLFLKQFRSFLIIILIVAAIISFALDDITDAMIIIAAVLINVTVGFIQEFKAQKALTALRHVITLEAKVRRDQGESIINATELVPGDIIELDAGDKVPADARLIKIAELEVNEAPLTGESTVVVKQLEPVAAAAGVGDRTNMVYTGTTVMRGSARAVVTHTGIHTELGRIAQLLKNTKEEATPLQKRLDAFAHNIGITILIICALILVIGLVKGIAFIEIFTTAVAIAVAAIPEGVAVAVTIILAMGMQRILKRRSLVRNLQAAETLGSTSVICTDKTGTITAGKMQVVSLVTYDYHFNVLQTNERHAPKGLEELIFALNIGMLCNDAHIVNPASPMKESVIVGNLTERALLAAGLNVGIDQQKLHRAEPRILTLPFDSQLKFMATLHEHPRQGHRIYVKGAPEKVMQMATKIRRGSSVEHFTPEQKKKFQAKFNAFSKQGLRILALAYKDAPATQDTLKEADVQQIIFVGFVGIKDPLRPNIRETFKRTMKSGITTVMITGDHKLTAQAIAREVGLPCADENILEGDELHAMSQVELNKIVQKISVYARVSPEDKLNIIKAWQSHGKVVAMTGDGVNDSPALKAADIGLALGSGTSVAKETADIVLLDDNYATIAAAVEEGRGIFENIRKIVLYLISDSFSEVLLIGTALVVGIPLPLLAAQILWINLVTDGLPNVALTMEPMEKEIMDEPPRELKAPIIDREMKILVVIISLVTGLGNVAIFWYFWRVVGDLDLARSVVFTALAIDSLLYVFSVRSLRHTIFSKNIFTNRWLIGAVIIAFISQLAAIYVPALQTLLKTVPLGLTAWGIIIIASVVVIVCIEMVKYIFVIRRHHEFL